MELVIGFVLFGISVTLFVVSHHAGRSPTPPRWVSENMVLCVIGPAIMVFGAAGSTLIGVRFVNGTFATFTVADLLEAGMVAAAFVALWIVLARRGQTARPTAQVIDLPTAVQAAPMPSPVNADQTPLKAA